MLSIIIPSLGRPSLLTLLHSIDRFTKQGGLRPQIDYECLVCFDPRANEFRSTSEFQICSIVSPRPGVNWARNEGARQSRGEILWFIDDDTELVGAHYFSSLKQIFSDQTVVAVGGDYLSPSDLSASSRGYNGLCCLWRTTSGSKDNEMLLGGTLAVRKSAWELADGFDSRIEYGGSETSFVLRIHQLFPQMKTIVHPRLDVVHRPEARSLRRWAALSKRQRGAKKETQRHLPRPFHRLRRAIQFLWKQDLRSVVATTLFCFFYLSLLPLVGKLKRA